MSHTQKSKRGKAKNFFLVKMIDEMFGHQPEENQFKDMNHKALIDKSEEGVQNSC